MDSFGSPEKKNSLFGEPSALPRTRRTGVWGEDNVKSGKSRKGSSTLLVEQERYQSAGSRGHDSDDDIPLIPNVEDIQDEDPLGDIAEAPLVTTNVIPSLSDLNADLKKQTMFKVFDDVNLTLLSKHLYNENELKEPDVGWTWDLLFTDVSSELRTEWEKDTTIKSYF